MKRIYILALALVAFTFAGVAQVEQTDDIEGYSLGPISPQDSHWRTWSGDNSSAESGNVSNEQANSPSQSMKIGPGASGGGPFDQLYLIDSQPFFGTYQTQFQMYVPSGQEGYFNVQGEIVEPQAGSFISSDIYFNQNNGSPGIGSTGGFTWNFPHDAWFPVLLNFDLDAQTYGMDVDGGVAIPAGTPWNASAPYLGGFDFFATSAFSLYYIDDMVVGPSILGNEDFSKEAFSIFPNPVSDVLNIRTQSIVNRVTVYDILGKTLINVAPDKISPTIDMSALPSGTYMVKVTIGDTTKTTKVLK